MPPMSCRRGGAVDRCRAELRPTWSVLPLIDGHVEKRDTGVTIAPNRVSDNFPTPGDAGLLSNLEAACERVGAKHRRMASGAGHDTAWMARWRRRR
jgi:N-carbamoyl-L-amino-acid hydrolase